MLNTLSFTKRGLVLSLDGDTFGFEENKNADIISIELDGECLTDECDFIIGFGDDDSYFPMIFAQYVRAGTYEGDNGAVDSHTVHLYTPTTSTFANGSVVTLLNDTDTSTVQWYKYSMWDAVAGGNGTQFRNLSDVVTWDEWPVTLSVSHYDDKEFTIITLTNGDRSVSTIVSDTFNTESDLYFTFTNDVSGAGEGFNISSVTISWDMYQNYTNTPTAEPSEDPTGAPSTGTTCSLTSCLVNSFLVTSWHHPTHFRYTKYGSN